MTSTQNAIPDWLDEIMKAARAVVPPFVAELNRLRVQLDPVSEALATAHKAISAALPPPDELVRLLQQFQKNSQWVLEAPKTLQTALAGKTVVHQELSLGDIGAIVRAAKDGGDLASVAKVLELHEELLADAGFRQRFRQRWLATGRLPIMNDVLAAYDAGLYSTAIPAALAQTEGVVAEFFGLSNLKQKDLKPRVHALHEADDFFEPLVASFLDGLLVPFDHCKPVPQLNRHAVQHGGDKTYGTKANAVTAIIWADYILGVTMDAKAKALASQDDLQSQQG